MEIMVIVLSASYYYWLEQMNEEQMHLEADIITKFFNLQTCTVVVWGENMFIIKYDKEPSRYILKSTLKIKYVFFQS